jgi:predicted phage-related endonuclease
MIHMTARTLNSKVSKLQELQAEIDALNIEAEGIRDAIKAEMAARAVDELKAGNAVVRWKVIVTRRFDTTGFKAVHSGLYEQFTQRTETKRFTLATA